MKDEDEDRDSADGSCVDDARMLRSVDDERCDVPAGTEFGVCVRV